MTRPPSMACAATMTSRPDDEVATPGDATRSTARAARIAASPRRWRATMTCTRRRAVGLWVRLKRRVSWEFFDVSFTPTVIGRVSVIHRAVLTLLEPSSCQEVLSDVFVVEEDEDEAGSDFVEDSEVVDEELSPVAAFDAPLV